ncbi:MAG: SDR family oxidoreductase [Myxococcota bacterium]
MAGCGYVGSALGVRLAAGGAQVFGLRRRPMGLPEGVEPVAADLTDPASLAALPSDLDLVYYAASAGARDPEAARRAYVHGVSGLLEALVRGPGPRRFFFVSSTGVYGQERGEWVDESSPTAPAHPAGLSLLEGERLSLSSPFPATVVRFGGIYGPGRTMLLERVRDGRARWRPGHHTNRIHREDCAGVLHWLASVERPAPIYLGVDDEPALERDVLSWLARQLGAQEPAAAPEEEGSGRARGSKRCRNRRLREAGYRFRYPTFREGYAELLSAPPPARRASPA